MDPQDELEAALAEKLVADLWRQRRIPIFEAKLYWRAHLEMVMKQTEESVRTYEESVEMERILAVLKKKQVADRDRQALEAAQQKLARERAELDDPELHVTLMLERSSPGLLNLWRQEAALSKSVQRTLHELQRLQAARAGEHVPVPAVADLDVNVNSAPSGDREDGQS